MKIQHLLYCTTSALFCACGSNTATTTPTTESAVLDSSVTQAPIANDNVVDEPVIEMPEFLKDDKVVIKDVLDLLVKEKEVQLEASDYKNMKLESNSTHIYVDIYGDSEDAGCRQWHEVGCFKKADGTYQVLYFYNSSCGGLDVSTFRLLTFVYDGKKLTKNDFQLPVPMFVDFLSDGVLYCDFNPKVVDIIKTGGSDSILQYSCYSGVDNLPGLEIRSNFGLYEDSDSNLYRVALRDYDYFLPLKYYWDGYGFKLDQYNSKLYVVNANSVGALRIGNAYNGQKVDGYEVVKNADSSYELKQADKRSLRIFTDAEKKIRRIDVFSPKFVDDYGLGVGHDMSDRIYAKADVENGIVYCKNSDGLCWQTSYNNIESCKKNEDGSLAEVDLKDGSKIIAITIGER